MERAWNIEIVKALDKIRINSLYVHNTELKGAKFSSKELKNRKVYLVETLAVLNALVERGTMMLFGGHGGGKTTLSKYLGQIFCHLPKDKIEDCILRGHPQLTEEKILGTLDFAQMLGKKDLVNGKITVKWNEFVTSRWKIIDEINRLSPYAQNILLSLLAEGAVKYHDESKTIDAYTLYATLNPKDNANTELSLPFKDRFALALPITMPDYDSFSTIGKRDKSSNRNDLSDYLPELELQEIQEDVKTLQYTDEAELFINYILASYRLCERVSKESNDDISVDRNLCENCHMNASDKVCCKIRQPLSVRVKEDLVRYGKALAWFLGDKKVTIEHILAIAPYMIWHRSVLSKRFLSKLTEHWSETDTKKLLTGYLTNLDLDGTRIIIEKIKDEFLGVKDILVQFERVKKGELSVDEFKCFIEELKNPSYNSLVISMEILPMLTNMYDPVYPEIVNYREQIDKLNDIPSLKLLKEELIFKYNIPNRQFLADQIDREIKKFNVLKIEFTLSADDIRSNSRIMRCLSLTSGVELDQLPKLKYYPIMDLTKDECSLKVMCRKEDVFKCIYEGDKSDEVYKYLESKNAG